MADLKTWTRMFVGTVGAAAAGPTGAIIGTFLGSLLAMVLPGSKDYSNQVLTNLGRISIENLGKKINARLADHDKKLINEDLQAAFRDAVCEAIIDIGGSDCFPKEFSAHNREVPATIQFPLTSPGRILWQRNSPLVIQVKECLNSILSAIKSQQIFPITPPSNLLSANALTYIESKNPEELGLSFYSENIQAYVKRFPSLNLEVPELEGHLRGHLYERTLVHLNEYLKDRTPAWRSFNRIVLESMQDDLAQVVSSQSEMLERLEALTAPENIAEFASWADQMAQLLGETGQISKKMDEGFESLTDRVISQHRELISQLNDLATASARIEKKVDRVLHVLSQKAYVDGDQPTIPMPKPPAPGQPPYKGLQYFSEEDAALFFGREKWIARLVTRLQNCRFLAVVGASGSGKSSIVRAGVIPVLKGQKDILEIEFKPPHTENWPILIITPGSHPFEALASSFSPKASLTELRALAETLKNDPEALESSVRLLASRSRSDHVLLVVDQFEELFTQLVDPEEQKIFINALMRAANPDRSGTLVLIIILRADFYANCAEFDSLRSALSQHQEYIGAMNEEEIKRAIEEPALRQGWHFEPGLVDLIVKDAGHEPGALPLLSHALLETWRNRQGHTMTLESYSESGGVKGAIAKTAEIVYNQRLSPPQQNIAKQIFLRLTNLEQAAQETRRRASLEELISSSDQVESIEKVINLLAESRLITVESNGIEVAHEALIREWPKLRGWLEENREGLRIHHRLTDASQEWYRMGKDEGLLYRGLRLQEAQEWAEANSNSLNSLEAAFLQASLDYRRRKQEEREEQHRRELEAAQKLIAAEKLRAEEQSASAKKLRKREQLLRYALIGAATLALIAVTFAIIANDAYQKANYNQSIAQAASTQAIGEAFIRSTAESNALTQSRLSQIRELSARSRSVLERDQDLSLLLGAQAIQLSTTYGIKIPEEAPSALYQALTNANFYAVLRGHTDAIQMAVFSPDGLKIATASLDKTAMVWGIDGRRLAVLKGHAGELNSITFSPDSKWILTSSNDDTAKIWQVNGTLERSLDGHENDVLSAVFSPDGEKVLSISTDATARIWDIRKNSYVILKGHENSVLSGAFSPDGSLVLTTSSDKSARLWKLDGTLVSTMVGHDSWVVSGQFSPDGQKILTASWDGTAKIWKLDGSLLVSLEGHESSIYSAYFNSDGTKVVTAGADNIAKVWSVDGKHLADIKGHTQQIQKAIFSPDGKIIATASLDNTVRLWLEDGTPLSILHGHVGFAYDVSFDRSGKSLVTASGDLTARIWHLSQLVHLIQGHYGAATSACFSPDGTSLMTAATDGFVRIWNQDGIKQYEFYTNGPINKAVFNNDGKKILVALNKNIAEIYDLEGNLLASLIGHTAKVNDAQFSPDGLLAVTASADGTAIIWTKDGARITTLKGHKAPVSSVSFSPDGKLILTASEDGTARFWTLDGTLLPLVLQHPDGIGSARFNPDGTKILTAGWDGIIYLWKIDGTKMAQFSGHTASVISAEFSPDGQLIISASIDGTARLWSINGEVITTLEGHTGWLNSAMFSIDGSRIVTSSWDGTVRLWYAYANAAQMVSEAARRVNRSLNNAECKMYLYVDRCP